MERLIFSEDKITEDLAAPFLQVRKMQCDTAVGADAVTFRQLLRVIFQEIDVLETYR